MYSILASLAAGGAVFAVVTLLMGPFAAILPAILAATIVLVILLRRATNGAQTMLFPMQQMMQAGKVDEVEELLVATRDQWGKWMPTLTGQLEAQRGMLDYVRMQWDDALPKLQNGQWRNWMAQACIACIAYRKGDKETAYAGLEKATKTGKKEPLAWIVRAVLLSRDGKRDEALKALSEGLTHLPNHPQLTQLQKTIANKKRVDTARYGQGWYQFFPEDLARQMKASHGRNQFGPGFRGPKMTKAQHRGR